jgi:DNA-binding CsgD family transcriptional regulator/glucan phosphoethanolaminetransferase (alkaline phosphatase superfamily)
MRYNKKSGIEWQNVIEKQRHAAFIYACIAMFGADIALWFMGMNAFGVPLYEILHPVHFVLTLLLLLLYMWGKLRVVSAVAILCIANQLAVFFELWLCVVTEPPHINLIMGYMVLTTLNMTLVLMTYIKVLPCVLAALAMVGYGACCWVSREPVLIDMLPIFLACFLVVALLGKHLVYSIKRLESEKSELKENEQKILNMFELDKTQLNAYISLAKEKGLSSEQTGSLLNMIGKQAQENIRANVSYYYRQREIDYSNLKNRLPELTPSEIEICDLILKEKKLKDIIRILGKSEGNITSQRTNIRRKLGLSTSENLRETLALRLTNE